MLGNQIIYVILDRNVPILQMVFMNVEHIIVNKAIIRADDNVCRSFAFLNAVCLVDWLNAVVSKGKHSKYRKSHTTQISLIEAKRGDTEVSLTLYMITAFFRNFGFELTLGMTTFLKRESNTYFKTAPLMLTLGVSST
jgi:hypothetical protein